MRDRPLLYEKFTQICKNEGRLVVGYKENGYAKTREECEEKLAELIKTMKAEIAAEKKKTAKA